MQHNTNLHHVEKRHNIRTYLGFESIYLTSRHKNIPLVKRLFERKGYRKHKRLKETPPVRCSSNNNKLYDCPSVPFDT